MEMYLVILMMKMDMFLLEQMEKVLPILEIHMIIKEEY
jgi:hypothetical protein